jgi:hypothetical protein
VPLQIFDNALVTAGLMDDGQVMIPRLNALMQKVLQQETGASTSSTTSSSSSSQQQQQEQPHFEDADTSDVASSGPKVVDAEFKAKE